MCGSNSCGKHTNMILVIHMPRLGQPRGQGNPADTPAIAHFMNTKRKPPSSVTTHKYTPTASTSQMHHATQRHITQHEESTTTRQSLTHHQQHITSVYVARHGSTCRGEGPGWLSVCKRHSRWLVVRMIQRKIHSLIQHPLISKARQGARTHKPEWQSSGSRAHACRSHQHTHTHTRNTKKALCTRSKVTAHTPPKP